MNTLTPLLRLVKKCTGNSLLKDYELDPIKRKKAEIEKYRKKRKLNLQLEFLEEPDDYARKDDLRFFKAGSYICGGFSVLTGASFIYRYILDLLMYISYSQRISEGLTFLTLLILENRIRVLTKRYLKGRIQEHQHQLRPLIWSIILIVLSQFFSIQGGFDFIQNTTQKPIFPKFTLIDIEKLTREHENANQLQLKAIEEYKSSQYSQYNNGFGWGNDKEYVEMIDKYNSDVESRRASYNNAVAENDKRREKAKIEYNDLLSKYNQETNQKGWGLVYLSIPATLLFLFCMYWLVRIDVKDGEYNGVLVPDEDTGINDQKYSNKPLRYLDEKRKVNIKEKNTLTEAQNNTLLESDNQTITRESKTHTNISKPPVTKSSKKEGKPAQKKKRKKKKGNEPEYVRGKKVLHIKEDGTMVELSISEVKSNFNTHTDRIKTAKSDKSRINNTNRMEYWQYRLQEFQPEWDRKVITSFEEFMSLKSQPQV